MERTVSLLLHFAENADSIVSEVKPGRASGLLEVMDRLAKRMDAICSGRDYCNGIFAFLLTADDIIEYILIYRGDS
ncbi:MAG: hypothetical protein DRI57_26590 [Deltaproteobacteria bacterium]|nr:MAG: hypothetical protein DRI57_26590 [Deltaproteobacteria bacterium]